MAFNWPQDCTTIADKAEYAMIVEEKMRKLQNVMARWKREGLTQGQYNQLPDFVKNRFSYTPQLTSQQWTDFYGIWQAKYDTVMNYIAEAKKNLRISNRWNGNIEEL